MKRIFKRLKEIESKGYYYRLIASPNNISIKLFSERDLTSIETNYSVDNSSDGRYCLSMYLDDFINKLS